MRSRRLTPGSVVTPSRVSSAAHHQAHHQAHHPNSLPSRHWYTHRPSEHLGKQARAEVLVAAWVAYLPLLLSLPVTDAALVALMLAGMGLYAIQGQPGMGIRIVSVLAAAAVAFVVLGTDIDSDPVRSGALALAGALGAYPLTIRLAWGSIVSGWVALLLLFLGEGQVSTSLLAIIALIVLFAASSRLTDRASGLTPVNAKTRATLRRLLVLMIPVICLLGLMIIPATQAVRSIARDPMWSTGFSGDTMRFAETQRLLRNPTTAMRVWFDSSPPTAHLYWRGSVLWRFDGVTWSRPSWSHEPVEPGQWSMPSSFDADPALITLDYTVEQLTRMGTGRFVLETTVPDSMPDATWSIDGLARQDTSGNTRARSLPRQMLAAPPVLEPEHREAALQLPPELNPQSQALAISWHQASPDPRQFVAQALTWFSQNMTYTLDPPPVGRHLVDDLLFETQQGYCQHFSTAFVVLARAAGIPARVVKGYYGGEPNEHGDYWRVRELNAHAWAEVWFEDAGWVRVDPTAAVSSVFTPPEPAGWTSWLFSDRMDAFALQVRAWRQGMGVWGERTALGRLSWERSIPYLTIALLLLVVMLSWRLYRQTPDRKWAPRRTSLGWRQRWFHARAHHAWRRFESRWRRAGHPIAFCESALAYTRRLSRLSELSDDPARRVALLRAGDDWSYWCYGPDRSQYTSASPSIALSLLKARLRQARPARTRPLGSWF